MGQILLLSDDYGKFTGVYAPKEECHKGNGHRHLAITVLVENGKGEVLLQLRKHRVFDKIWDFTGSTNLLHRADGTDESFEDATLRCLKEEYEIVEKVPLRNLGSFNYFARYGPLCENEHCAMMVGEYSGPLNLNPTDGYEYKWMPKAEFLKDVKRNPQKYTPWVIPGVKVLEKAGFFKP